MAKRHKQKGASKRAQGQASAPDSASTARRTDSAEGTGYDGMICVKSFRHWRTGKIITAAPGKVFCFVPRARRSS